jgi:hypothetical protein
LNTNGSFKINNRQVFATPSGTGNGSGGAEKTENEDDKKKEEEEKKKKDEEEKKKKEKEKEEEEKKKKKEAANDTDEDEPEEDDVETTKERIARMAKSAVESSEKLQEEMKLAEKEKYNPSVEKMRQLNKEMAAINKEDEKASEPVKTYLAELTTSKKITKKKAKIIFGLDPLDEKFEAKFKNAMKGAGLDMSSPEAKKLKELKEQEGIKVKAIDKKIKEKMTKLRELTSEVSKVITLKANQEKALKMMSTGVGLSLKPGQVLTYENEDKKDKKKNYATIKEITYDHIEVLDENGNVIEKVPSSQPKVTVESINPATSKIETDTFNQTEFHEWTYQNNVHEDIDSLAKLKESIGFEPKKGSQFEFEEVINSADQKPQYESRNVEIKVRANRSSCAKVLCAVPIPSFLSLKLK